jgi:hypothetical protein
LEILVEGFEVDPEGVRRVGYAALAEGIRPQQVAGFILYGWFGNWPNGKQG